MKTFVLILMFWHGDGASVSTHEFSSLDTCTTAGKLAQQDIDNTHSWNHLHFVCSEK